MQKNMERAMRESGLGRVENDSVDNLFIVSEPEAAAAFMLASGTTPMITGETFVLIDAGGGTVDTITYTIGESCPLKVKAEGVEAGGDLCGSSYLNEALREHLSARLRGEDYLEVNRSTIEGIIDKLLVRFENDVKRNVDVAADNVPTVWIDIPGLRANKNPDKRFLNNRLKMGCADLKKIFDPLLERVAVLMKAQLDGAKEKGLTVRK